MERTLWLISAALIAGSTHAFAGQASYNEVLSVVRGPVPSLLLTEEAQEEIDAYAGGKIPQYQMSVPGILSSLAFRAFHTLKQDVDYYDRLEKQIHQNGVCLAGTWEITQPSAYSGYFASGSKGLFIGRASAATNPTRVGGNRAFGFAGKLFPTQNPDEIVKTANFFTVDDLGGTRAQHFMDVALTNEPVAPGLPKSADDIEFNGKVIATLLTGAALAGDPKLGFRPLWAVSEAGASGSQIKTPHWIQIRAAEGMPRVDQADFRSELNVSAYPNSAIDLDILVSDSTKETGLAAESKWQRIGRIHLTESYVTYGCDRRLHFPHPKNR